jgi:hypothetical protein
MDDRLPSLLQEADQYLTTIPCIGVVLAATVLGNRQHEPLPREGKHRHTVLGALCGQLLACTCAILLKQERPYTVR